MAPAPDRIVCMGTIPMTNVNDAVKELEHCAKLGIKGIKLDRYPSGKSYPTPEDDKFWAAALDLGIALTNHNNGNMGSGRGEPDFLYPRNRAKTAHRKAALNFSTASTTDP